MSGRDYPTLGDEVISGAEKTIAYLRLCSGEQPAEQDLRRLSVDELAKMKALMRRMADHGITNREQFSLVEAKSGIFAFKAKRLRLLCFQDVDHLILLVGCGRINGRLPRPLVVRAKELREQYRRGKIATIDRRAAG